jgi:hypothetical protein
MAVSAPIGEQYMTPIADLERQARWELEGIRVATERYREAALAADPTTLPPGSKLLRSVIPPLAAALRLAQLEATDAINKGGRYAAWCWPMQLLDADKLAIIAATVGLRVAMSEGRAGTSIASQSKLVTTAMRDQIEFDRWEEEQELAKKEAKRLKKEDFEDLLGRLKHRYPTVDRRVWARWRAKLQLTRDEPWSEETVCVVGACLFDLLIKSSPDTFRMDERALGGGQVSYSLRLTPEAQEVLKDLTARAEVARPLLMPMLTKPLPWRYAA